MIILCAICKAWTLTRRAAYVCACGYTVREDDREFHSRYMCTLTVPEDLCPSCGAIHTVGDCDDIAPNAGSAC